MPTHLLLVRHGQSVANRENRLCGHTETPLTEQGIEQARSLGRRLSGTRIDVAFSSDLSRAGDTARFVLGERGVDVVIDTRLRDVNYGEWEASRGVEAMGGQNRDRWRAFLQGSEPSPGGESIFDVRVRMAAALLDIADRYQGKTVLAVSHGSPIMAAVAEFLRLPLASSLAFQVDNASLSRLSLERDGRAVLITFNDVSHLD